ncbi:sigma-70 family RNA polymerase sigma factor [Streptomyces sp. NPDC059009]|uniref:sigma-70 family RNA polymerase sigma factor n=1 Tax=Streptomyces sp. NPDC059009 TaxID=3346694 RepID=UPI003683B188
MDTKNPTGTGRPDDALAALFEENRSHLKAVAYRMLGSLSEAEDAVQEAWLKLSRADTGGVTNLGGWLTTVVSRVCLDMLRSRTSRREEPLDTHVPDPVVRRAAESAAPPVLDPEQEALLADSVGLALLVVLDTLAPAERLAFVLHDLFAMPFDEVAPIVERTPAATRQLASRARRRVRSTAPEPDHARQREVVGAFLAASRGGDFDALVTLLDPDVVLRADSGALEPGGWSRLVRGAADVARQAAAFGRFAHEPRLVLINGVLGVLSLADGKPQSLMDLTVVDGRIVEINILADAERLAALGVPELLED